MEQFQLEIQNNELEFNANVFWPEFDKNFIDHQTQHICRFCLVPLENESDEVTIDLEVRKHFENLTNVELKSESNFPTSSCQKCYTDITNSSLLKTKLLTNQEKLEEMFFPIKQENPDTKEVNYDALQFEVKTELLEELENQDSENQKNEPKESVSCTECGKEFTNERNLQRHVDRVHSEKPKKTNHREKVLCTECGQYFTKTSLRRHKLRIHDKIRQFQCDICAKEFFRKEEIQNHLKVHMNVPRATKAWPCPECGKNFSYKDSLKNHLNAQHLKKNIICCEFCGKSFSTNTNYQNHLRSTHTLERPFQCDICDKRYFSKGDLSKHKVGSHSETATCDKCSKVFRSRITMLMHIRMMHREKTHECQNCDKKFSTQHLLERHVQRHLGLKKYQCPHCEVRYFKPVDLRRHILSIHMKVKIPCELPGCKSQFARKETYRNHVISHHSSIGDENVQILLKRIRHMKLPKPDFNGTYEQK